MTKFWSLYCRIRQGFRSKEGEDLRKDERLLKTDSKKVEELSAFFEIYQHYGQTTRFPSTQRMHRPLGILDELGAIPHEAVLMIRIMREGAPLAHDGIPPKVCTKCL